MITKITKLLSLLALCLMVNNISAQVYWGTNPGEGDFDGGLNGWTVNAVAEDGVWDYSPTGIVDGGSLAGQGSTINSATAANGAATFNADFYTFDGGTPGDPPYPQYVSELISPDIDLSAVAPGTGLAVEFNQMVLFFQAATDYTFTSFAVSGDGGATWSENIDCNEGLLPSTANSPQPVTNNVVKIGIPNAANLAGSTNAKIKFTFAGNFYYWALDDIKIVARDGNDLRVQSNFYAIAPNTRIPASQVEPFGFLADVFNAGGNDAPNAELQMEIVTGGAAVYNESVSYGTMVSDSLYENVSWGSFTPSTIGSYTGTYTLVSDSVDVNPGDNSISFDFAVTDSTFAKETGPTRDILPGETNWDPAESKNWAYGNHFHIVNGEGFEMTSAGVVITAQAGMQVAIYLYEWEDDNADGICDPTERSRVGYNFYSVTNVNTINFLAVIPMLDIITNNGGVPLQDSTDYALMVEYTDAGEGNEFALGASETFNYGAAILNSEQIGVPRYAALLGISGDLSTEGYSSGGFGTDIVPVVRMHVNAIQPVSNKNVLSVDNILEVTPNPASEFVNINIDLVENNTNASLRVLDVTGKVIESRVFSSLQKEQLTFDVSNWTPGSYFVYLTTKDGIKSHHFIVGH